MKEYKNCDIIVYWYPERCSHPGTCLRLLPEVFDLYYRPWVNVDAASPEKIMACIDKCPSGALKYSLPEGSTADRSMACGVGSLNYHASSAVKIKVSGRGPLSVEGPTEVISPDGEILREDSRLVLCGCGKTQSCPFCDGSHNHR